MMEKENIVKRNLDGIFKPKSIAIIGASTKGGTIGHEILHNLIEFHFNGKVFPVNPKAEVIHSIKCYSTILDVPDAVDLAIIVVPRDHVAAVLDQCGRKGVKGIVTITAGFKETGPEGTRHEQKLVDIVRQYNMRMVGPNCFGVLNAEKGISMNATFSKESPLRGKVGFLSQSGALGEAILGYANELNLGFSMFVSVGNKADISGNDLLEYWKDDPGTDIILMYLESFGEPETFTRIAREITRKKPIIAVKAGRTDAGAKAVSSHTGALAGLDVGTDAFFDQCGILRVTSIDELFDVAVAFSNQPIPRGDRIAIITNAGGPGILATDAVVSLGMKMAKFEKKTIKHLRANLLAVAAVENPVDVIASGGPDAYRAAMDAVLSDKNVDAVIVIFVPPVVVDHRAVINGILEMIEKHKNDKTVLGCFMAVPSGIAGSEEMVKNKIPIYTFPESAAKAMAKMVRYRKWIDRPRGKVIRHKVDKSRAKRIVEDSYKTGIKTIVGEDALNILDAYGINIAQSERATSRKKIGEIASRLGFPLIMKIDDPDIVHKSDVGGVSGILSNEREALVAFSDMKKRFSGSSKKFSGVILQELVTGGVETIIGMNHDASYGSLMMFGLGGIYVEIMKDVAFKIHPVTDYGAREMVRAIKGYPLLEGFRGAVKVNIKSVEDAIIRLSQLVGDFPEIESCDINPFIASPRGKISKAVDARLVLRDR